MNVGLEGLPTNRRLFKDIDIKTGSKIIFNYDQILDGWTKICATETATSTTVQHLSHFPIYI